MKEQGKYINEPLGRRLSSIGRCTLAILDCKLSHLDIDRSFYPLLLIEHGDGKLAQQDLCYLLKTDKVSVLRIVDYLSENGYVTREQDSNDKRKYCLVATIKAKNEIENIKKAMQEVEEQVYKGLNEIEILNFMQTLDKIEQNISINS